MIERDEGVGKSVAFGILSGYHISPSQNWESFPARFRGEESEDLNWTAIFSFGNIPLSTGVLKLNDLALVFSRNLFPKDCTPHRSLSPTYTNGWISKRPGIKKHLVDSMSGVKMSGCPSKEWNFLWISMTVPSFLVPIINTWLEKWNMNDDGLDISPIKNEGSQLLCNVMFMRGKHLRIVKKELWTLLSRWILSKSIHWDDYTKGTLKKPWKGWAYRKSPFLSKPVGSS